MNRGSVGQFIIRIVSVLGGLILLGLIFKLIGQVLTPVLPQELMSALSDGWRLLYNAIAPALPAIAALFILVAICWVALGRKW